MSINWVEFNKVLSPIRDYDDLCNRWQASFSYPFVQQTFNFTVPVLEKYTHSLLGGDSRNRYTDYEAMLVRILNELHQAGVENVINLTEKVTARKPLEFFVEHSGVPSSDIANMLKYLTYWFIPLEKYLSGLVRSGSNLTDGIKLLGEHGIRTNLQLLQAGITLAGRTTLVNSTGLPRTIIEELVNRADFSRLPWSSKATISNIIGAGYGSLSLLANADPKQLYADFFRYGKSIGKNLKLGNEIENSYRIAKIVPGILQND